MRAMGFMMPAVLMLAGLMLAVLMLAGCCPCRHLASSTVRSESDSTCMVYRERVTVVADTVWVELPRQTAERTTADSVSHLETDYALSDARICADGSLLHTLENKRLPMAVPAVQKTVWRDSVSYRGSSSARQEARQEGRGQQGGAARVPWLWKLIFWCSVGLNVVLLIAVKRSKSQKVKKSKSQLVNWSNS